jgi:hypothetical protein
MAIIPTFKEGQYLVIRRALSRPDGPKEEDVARVLEVNRDNYRVSWLNSGMKSYFSHELVEADFVLFEESVVDYKNPNVAFKRRKWRG